MFQLAETKFAKNIYWVFGMILKEESNKSVEDIISYLTKNGIGTRPFFWPTHLQPVFKKKDGLKMKITKMLHIWVKEDFISLVD